MAETSSPPPQNPNAQKAGPKEIRCTVTDRRSVAAGTFEVTLEATPSQTFKAGQFISIVIPPSPLNPKPVRRAYSIASHPEHSGLQLCVTLVENGPGSTYLSRLRPGDALTAFFPYGDFVFRTPPSRRVVFVATGTGISPFRSIGLSAAYQSAPPKSALLLFGARTRAEVLYEDEMARVPGLKRVNCLSREAPTPQEPFFQGRVTDYLRKLSLEDSAFPWAETDFYLCGNGAMIKEVEAFLKEKGLTKDAIRKEAYYQPK